MDLLIKMVDKNPTQVTLSFLGSISSSDVAKEYIIVFFLLLQASILVAIICQLAILVFHRYNSPVSQNVILGTLLCPLFIALLIYLSHHLISWPDIHRSSYTSLEIGDNALTIVLWITYTLITVIEHKIHKIGMRWILIGSLSPFFINVIIFITHHLVKIPAVIY